MNLGIAFGGSGFQKAFHKALALSRPLKNGCRGQIDLGNVAKLFLPHRV